MADNPPGASAQDSGAYEVGYGKPPRHSRFQKGKSGNRKGRPPRSKNVGTLLTKALNERVPVTENGRRRMITKREVIVTQLVNRSAAADLKAIGMLLGMLQQADAASADRPDPENRADADQQVLAVLRQRLAHPEPDDDAEHR